MAAAWNRTALLLAALAAGSRWGAGAGMFDCPEHLEPLQLHPAGTKGWRVLATALSPAGGVVHPGEMVSLELTLRNEGDKPLAAEPILELVRIGSRFDRFERGYEVSALVPLAKPVRVQLPPVKAAAKQEVALAWKQDKADALPDFGLYAAIVEFPDKGGRQAAATIARVRPPNAAG
ncbi:MAG: hypothetical protein FJ290_19635, partial [Planctomycetes bacterium]|nr:hypothetical protein [Planctomycetota bacterium]